MQNIANRAAERKTCPQEPNLGRIADLPVNLDPAHHRIIAIHFFGWRSIDIASKAATDACYLPPPPLYEVRG